MNIHPLEVRIIDFDRAVIKEQRTINTIVGTPGYFPNWAKMRDGSKDWDIYSLACIILETDMPSNAYYKTAS